MKKGLFGKALRFAEKNGFYIVLGLCAVAIGVSGYVLFFTGTAGEPTETVLPVQEGNAGAPRASADQSDLTVPIPQQEKQKEQEVFSAPVTEPKKTEKTEKSDSNPSAAEKTAEQEKPKTNAVQVSGNVQVKAPVYALPVKGAEIQRPFSGNELVFDATMGDWRTHNGTDFSCEEGDEVAAVLDGTVEQVYSDTMLGNCVLIDHGAGIRSLTCGLASLDGAKEGSRISAGQSIGRAGKTMTSESGQSVHVHLEMTRDGAAVDPMTILK